MKNSNYPSLEGTIKLNDEQTNELESRISEEISHIQSNQAEMLEIRRDCIKAYKGDYPEPPNDGAGSKFVSKDVADAVNTVMPEMVKVFLSSYNTVEFVAKDIANANIAKDLTYYASKSFELSNGYQNLTNSIKNGLLLGAGFLKTEFLEKESVEYESYAGLTQDELGGLVQQDVELDGEAEQTEQGINVKVKKVSKSQDIVITAPAPETMYISNEKPILDDCRFIGERMLKSTSDLVKMGYDRKTIEESAANPDDSDRLDDVRKDSNTTIDNLHNDLHDYWEIYTKYDLDDDGIAEDLKICAIGDNPTILAVYPSRMQPYSIWSPVTIPNTIYGESLAEQLLDIQNIKSTIQRMIIDNIYLQNFPTEFVYAELLTDESKIRIKTPKIGQKLTAKLKDGSAVNPLVTAQRPYIASDSLNLLNQIDKNKIERTGISPDMLATDINVINKTATEALINENTKHTKLVTYIRNYAENCLKECFKKVADLTLWYDDSNETYKINEYSLAVNVGLGTDTKSAKLQGLMIVGEQQAKIIELMGPDNPFINQSHQVKLARAIAEATGIPNYEQYLPEVDVNVYEEYVQQNQAQAMNAETMAAQQQQEALMMQENIKMEIAKADIAIKEKELALREQELAQKAKEFEAKTIMDMAELESKNEIETSKLELKDKELDMEYDLKSDKIASGERTNTNLGV